MRTASPTPALLDLEGMLEVIGKAPAIYRPARFWADLNQVHLQQLSRDAFDHFKRTVNTRYFNWGILTHQWLGVTLRWLTRPVPEVFQAEFPSPRLPGGDHVGSFDPASAWLYKTFVAMYAEILSWEDPEGLLGRLQEPDLGNPFLIRYRGRGISQDLCNSIHEFYSMMAGETPLVTPSRGLHFAELGAGYGRLAYAVLAARPTASYCIIDIPPALYVSQRYLTSLYPDISVFLARQFDSYESVREEFESARLKFLLPHQLELLPPKQFDYFINISTLHEMTSAQVENYFRQMGRLCRGRVYTKQWRVSRTRVNGCTLREGDYPVPRSWKTVFHRRHPIQRMFFEALYAVG